MRRSQNSEYRIQNREVRIQNSDRTNGELTLIDPGARRSALGLAKSIIR
jgi:hypothetical protein